MLADMRTPADALAWALERIDHAGMGRGMLYHRAGRLLGQARSIEAQTVALAELVRQVSLLIEAVGPEAAGELIHAPAKLLDDCARELAALQASEGPGR